MPSVVGTMTKGAVFDYVVAPADVGAADCEWNANKLRSVTVKDEAPGAGHDGYVLTYNHTTGELELQEMSVPTAADIADAVCDELLSGHTGAGSVGKALSDLLDRLTAARAALLDKLDVTGDVASYADLTAAVSSLMGADSRDLTEVFLKATLNNTYIGLALGEITSETYGLAKLVRSTTPANTLDVDADGKVTIENRKRHHGRDYRSRGGNQHPRCGR